METVTCTSSSVMFLSISVKNEIPKLNVAYEDLEIID
jgi:hypothetical protein